MESSWDRTTKHLTNVIREISAAGLDIEDQGHPADYVGVTITKHSNGCIEFTQRALIDAIINDVNIGDAYTKPVPAKATQQLHAFKDSLRFDECDFGFNYRSVTGKLNYLTQTSRSDLLFATHQVAKYSSDPRKEHGEAIIYMFDTWRRHVIWDSSSGPMNQKGLNATVTQTSQATGTKNLPRMILARPSLEVDG